MKKIKAKFRKRIKSARKIFSDGPNILLVIVLIFAFILRVFNLNSNSLFRDEAIYIRLGLESFNGNLSNLDPYLWMGGWSLLYPTITAIGFEIGGVFGARFINVILGTICVYLFYVVVKKLKLFKNVKTDKHNGIFAAALFAASPLPIFLSRTAISDVLSLTFLLTGIVFLQKYLQTKTNNKYFFAIIIFLILAILTKYTALMIIPFIILGAIIYAYKYNRKRLEEVLILLFVLIVGIGFYVNKQFDNLTLQIENQIIDRNIGQLSSLITIFAKTSIFFYIPAFIGFVILFMKDRYVAIFLSFLAIVPLLVYIYTQNLAAFDQITIYSLLFILPLVSSFFAWIGVKEAKHGVIIAVLFTSCLLVLLGSQIQEYEDKWRDSAGMTDFAEVNLKVDNKSLLEFENAVSIMVSDSASSN